MLITRRISTASTIILQRPVLLAHKSSAHSNASIYAFNFAGGALFAPNGTSIFNDSE